MLLEDIAGGYGVSLDSGLELIVLETKEFVRPPYNGRKDTVFALVRYFRNSPTLPQTEMESLHCLTIPDESIDTRDL